MLYAFNFMSETETLALTPRKVSKDTVVLTRAPTQAFLGGQSSSCSGQQTSHSSSPAASSTLPSCFIFRAMLQAMDAILIYCWGNGDLRSKGSAGGHRPSKDQNEGSGTLHCITDVHWAAVRERQGEAGDFGEQLDGSPLRGSMSSAGSVWWEGAVRSLGV